MRPVVCKNPAGRKVHTADRQVGRAAGVLHIRGSVAKYPQPRSGVQVPTELTWHNVWMASHGREIALEMRAVGHAVAEGSKPLGALAAVVGVAVLREGSEVALFLYGVGTSEGGSALGLTFGGCLGLLLGVAVCLLTYLGLVRIPPRALFATTTVLITLLAAGMAAQAVALLERANWLTSLDSVVWDSGWFLSEASIPGRALHTLIGYSDQPTQMQLIVYLVVIAVTGLLMWLTARVRGENAIAPA